MEYYGNNDFRDYHLAHYGVVGMHWGIRRYQPYSVAPRGSGKRGKEIGLAGRISGGLSEGVRAIKRHRAERRIEKTRKANLKKAREAREAKKAQDAEKQRILRSGSADELLKNKELFNNDEVRAAIDRIQLDQSVQQLKNEQNRIKLEKAEQINELVKTVTSYGETALSLYGTGKKVYNAVNEMRGLPSLEERTKQAAEERKKAADAANKAKQDAILSGDPEKIKKYQGQLTSSEQAEYLKVRDNNAKMFGNGNSDNSSGSSSDNKINHTIDNMINNSRNGDGNSSGDNSKPFTKDDMSDSLKDLIKKTSPAHAPNGDERRKSPAERGEAPSGSDGFDKVFDRANETASRAREVLKNNSSGTTTTPDGELRRKSPAERSFNEADAMRAIGDLYRSKTVSEVRSSGPSKATQQILDSFKNRKTSSYTSSSTPKLTLDPDVHGPTSASAKSWTEAARSSTASAEKAAAAIRAGEEITARLLNGNASKLGGSNIGSSSSSVSSSSSRKDTNNYRKSHGLPMRRTIRHEDAFGTEYYGANDWRNYLSHHGVVGMHWGIRRYQPYGEGGYNRIGGKKGKEIGEARKAGNKSSKSTERRIDKKNASAEAGNSKNPIEKGVQFKKDNNLLSSSDYKWGHGTDRQNAAADLGLEAMVKLNYIDNSQKDRDWFMVEDQTIGFGMIADLVNQGKTKKEINAILEKAKKETAGDYELAMSPGYFELREYNGGDTFIDACLEIKNSGKSNSELKPSLSSEERDEIGKLREHIQNESKAIAELNAAASEYYDGYGGDEMLDDAKSRFNSLKDSAKRYKELTSRNSGADDDIVKDSRYTQLFDDSPDTRSKIRKLLEGPISSKSYSMFIESNNDDIANAKDFLGRKYFDGADRVAEQWNAEQKIKRLNGYETKNLSDMVKNPEKNYHDMNKFIARYAKDTKQNPEDVDYTFYALVDELGMSPNKAFDTMAKADGVRKDKQKRTANGVTNAQATVMKGMMRSGYTMEDIAKRFGVSPSTVSRVVG